MLVKRVDAALREAGEDQRNIILAVLAEVGTRYLNTHSAEKLAGDSREME